MTDAQKQAYLAVFKADIDDMVSDNHYSATDLERTAIGLTACLFCFLMIYDRYGMATAREFIHSLKKLSLGLSQGRCNYVFIYRLQ